MYEFTTADKINLAIAIGTCIAAFSSLIAAFIAKKSTQRAEFLTKKNALEEKKRWLTDIIFSLANQCNECVTKSGVIMPTEANVSRMITILCNAIDLIKRESPPDHEVAHLKNLWIFLHSSIWVEIKSKDVFESLQDFSPHTMPIILLQYNKVRNEIMTRID